MSKNLIFSALLMSSFVMTSCSKQAPLVVKNEVSVAPAPEVYTSTMAIDDLSLLDESNASEIISRISTKLATDNDWSLFWKDLYVKYNTHAWSGTLLHQVFDLSAISCGKKGSLSFSEFTQKVFRNLLDEDKEVILVKALKHYVLCDVEVNKILVREYLSHYKKLENKQSKGEFVKLFSDLMNRPLDEELSDVAHMVASISNRNEKLDLYYSFKNNYHYRGIVDQIIDSFDYSEIVHLVSEDKIDFDDALEILNISRHQQLNLSQEDILKLLLTVKKNYQRATSKLMKYNLSKFHYETLRNLRYLSLSEVEAWASFALDHYNEIGVMYPKNSIARYFLSTMSGVVVDIDTQVIDEKIEQLLVQRAKLQSQKDIQKNLETYSSLCKLYAHFGHAEFKYTKAGDLNKLGCKKYSLDKEVEITEAIEMPLFSGFDTEGADVRFHVRPNSLSVINTSQMFQYEKISDPEVDDKYQHIVVPLVFAFSPLKDKGRFKVGQKHYIAIHHVYRDARELTPGLEGVFRPLDGKRAGNLIFTKETFAPVKHIALGGDGQKAALGKAGAHSYVNKLNEFEIRSWVESFVGNSNYYFSDQFKNVRNLKNLIEASTSEDNRLSLYIDPDYIATLTDLQRESLLKNLDEIRALEGMGNVSHEIVLETLVRRSTRMLMDTVEGLDYSASLSEAIPSILTELDLGMGPRGERYNNGKRGQNGQTIVE